jgi:hypothetical protein
MIPQTKTETDMTTKNQFVVQILSNTKNARASGVYDAIIYQGDDHNEAERLAAVAARDPQWKGRVLRFYNYALFGGGLKDTEL